MSRTFLLAPLILVALLAGCHAPASEDTLILAFTFKDDTAADADPARLAAWIEEQTGRPTKIHSVQSEGAAIEALRFGHAHAAFLDGGAAWVAWKEFGLDAIAADQNSDGRTYYQAQAWVRADSTIQDFADLAGVTSCHTGRLKSAGMLMPMGYLIGNGFATVVGSTTDITSLDATVQAHFKDPVIPESGHPYYNYDGALRCLTEGAGDVAFVKDTTWDDYCATEAPAWCAPKDTFRVLPPFGNVPSHPVMVSPHLSAEGRDLLRDALVALNDSDEGKDILRDVLNTPGITSVDTATHLGSYSDVVQHVPGLASYFKTQHKIGA